METVEERKIINVGGVEYYEKEFNDAMFTMQRAKVGMTLKIPPEVQLKADTNPDSEEAQLIKDLSKQLDSCNEWGTKSIILPSDWKEGTVTTQANGSTPPERPTEVK